MYGTFHSTHEAPEQRLPGEPRPRRSSFALPTRLGLLSPPKSSPRVDNFSFIVATALPDEHEHPSGWTVSLDLVDAGGIWRSGEGLRGKVTVRPLEGREQVYISSIVVRGYWQSSTVFSTFTHTPPSAKSTTLSRVQSPGVASPPTECERAEYHRGYFPGGGEGIELYEGRAERIRREIDGDFALLPGGWNGSATPSSAPSPPPSLHEPTTYDFAFTLPTKTQSNFANPSDDPPYDRGRLMNLPRSPPPSFDAGDGGRTGIVEYIIEVLLRTDEPTPSLADLSGPSEELPSFLASFAANGELSSRGFLRSTPSVLVKRITFPFEPYDRHVDSLDSGWQNGVTKTGAVPSLGRDPRDELTGSKLAEGQGSRGWIDANGGLEKWTTYGKDILLKSGALQRVAARLRCEISLPAPATVNRFSATLPLLLHLELLPPSTKGLLSPRSTSLKPIAIDKLTIVVFERILTRSGRALRPSMTLNEVRRETFKLWDEAPVSLSPSPSSSSNHSSSSSSDKVRPHLLLHPSPLGLNIPLSFPLQSTSESHPLSSAGLSFRLPNLEREFFLAISIHPVGQAETVLCRCPVQVLAGDEAPAWEEVVREETRGGGGGGRGMRTERARAEGEEKLPSYA